ncbi:hypothetical protein M409DRAFT_30312 [Zasmidium cellare ATCC 36951]|uniref:Stress-response A/B barrel domain-containing protein n=1 Tax=Zasmidium cellare ATCC 36951 TaxID=1080233 RepID=A0A6A6BX61_ZASCE|nr:uncharacterized protein M409DRAFT_30312 [Zasmidium cellare ATCC 36951]KAF2159173.1 hypothetical protein M409DRAFT_30312 [Zasmidium cellare ATCC 36951]
MPIYHLRAVTVLVKLKPGASSSQIAAWSNKGRAMVGQIPGLVRWQPGPPLEVTKHRCKGFGMAVVAILDKEEDIAVYTDHPAHREGHHLREAFCDETVAYDLEFE